jgi:hypothetical protein
MADEIKKTEVNQLPEAPASATVKIKSKDGFEWLFTIRDESAKTLMFKMKAMESNWTANGFTPLAQGFGKKAAAPKEYVEGRVCPVDGGKLIKPPTGSKAPIKCENNKWNPTTKQSFGCQYKYWPDQEPVQPIPERQLREPMPFKEGEYEGY